MELLIIKNGAERKAARQTQDHEAEMQQLSDDCRRQIEAAREEAEAAKGRSVIVTWILLMLVVVLHVILWI